MSAREILATTYIEGHNRPIGHLHAKAIEVALTAAGFSIVHKDEIHAPSATPNVAKAIEALNEADVLVREHGKPYPSPLLDVWRCVTAALRELMKEVGR